MAQFYISSHTLELSSQTIKNTQTLLTDAQLINLEHGTDEDTALLVKSGGKNKTAALFSTASNV